MVTRTRAVVRRMAVAAAVTVGGGSLTLASPAAANHQTVIAVQGSAPDITPSTSPCSAAPSPATGRRPSRPLRPTLPTARKPPACPSLR